jgi:uncharacterized protein with FMN-binding domain
MRRVFLAFLSTAAALVLVLSYKTHGSSSLATPPAAVSSAAPSTSTTTTTTTSSSAKTKAKTATTTTTVTGDSVETRYGPVQVQIKVTSGKVVSATAIDYPTNDPRDQQINSYAIPALNQEAVSAGSANIDMVSGATFTSDGYIQSLQSALDKAGV